LALSHGMAKTPSERPETAGALVKELEWAIAQPVEIEVPAAPARRGVSPWLILAVVVVVGLGLFLLLGAGVAGYVVLSRPGTPTPTSTRPPTATAESTSAPTPAVAGLPFSDDFSNPNSGFVVRNQGDATIQYLDGQLQFDITQSGFEFVSYSRRVDEADVDIQVAYTQLQGPPNSEIGLACRLRQDGDDYEAAAISGSGSFRLWEQRNGSSQDLVPWTAFVPASAPDEGRHTLGLTCRGSDLILTYDGAELGRATDSNPQSGDIGLLVGLGGQPPLTVGFDDLQVSN
jgi:hypothetical protein